MHVSIADVAALIRPASDIDHEALRRTFSSYRAYHPLPMLPRTLAEDKASLLAGHKRPTLTISIPLDSAFEMGQPAIRRTSLQSERRFHYEEVDRLISRAEGEYGELLRVCSTVAQGLLARRRARGALAVYDINRCLITSEEGVLQEMLSHEVHFSHIIIQEFMILANEAVATFLAERQVPALFRNHTAKTIAPDRAAVIQAIEDAVAHPEAFPLATLQKRVNLVLRRAYYSPVLEGHYGLNVPAYLHCTSPIRRYADLVNQRILAAVVSGQPSPYNIEQLHTIATHINNKEQDVRNKRKAALKESATSTTVPLLQIGCSATLSKWPARGAGASNFSAA